MLILPKLFVNNRQKSYAHLLKRELYWTWYALLCRLQHQPIMESAIELEITKPDGKITDKIKVRGETKVRNYDNFICQNMLGIKPATYSMSSTLGEGTLVLKDTGGTVKTNQYAWKYGTGIASVEDLGSATEGLMGYAGSLIRGIALDASNTDYTYEQTSAVSLIANGTGAGQLAYGDTWLPYYYPNDDLSVMTCRWERVITNNTEDQSSVDVKAICLYGYAGDDTGTGGEITFMLARDVLPATITLAYQEQIKGRWVLQHDRNA